MSFEEYINEFIKLIENTISYYLGERENIWI